MITLDIAASTHTGLVRHRNEDSYGISGVRAVQIDGEVYARSSVAAPVLVVVADGLGGHPAGDEASRLAVDHVVGRMPVDAEGLVDAILSANELLVESMNEAKGNVAMGSTIAAVLIDEDGLVVANVGDSPVMEMADERLHQLTVDDSPIGAGRGLPGLPSSVVTQTVGGHARIVAIQVHVHEDREQRPRRLLVCSDGLTSYVPRDRIAGVLAADVSVADAVDKLITLALDHGGRDNVTVVVVDVETRCRPDS